MDEQVKTLLGLLKGFRENNNITDEEFAQQLADGIIDGEYDDPCLSDTFIDFTTLMNKALELLEARLMERFMRS